MSSEYIKKIRTEDGDKQIDYEALANLPDLSGYAKQSDLSQLQATVNDKLDSYKLPVAINDALTQAKASGEFKGNDGKTPVKGTDYFTEEDKQEFVIDVLNALPTWQGGSY